MADRTEIPLRGAYWVQPGRLLAGPYPGAAAQSRMLERLGAVIAAGVTFFLDLTEAGELRDYRLDAQTLAAAKGRRVQHHRMPIRDLGVPTRAQMAATLDVLDGALVGGHVVYVHCMGGIGRTGTVIGCWLVRHGMDGSAALETLTRLRGGDTGSPETVEQRVMVTGWREDAAL
jgi:protein-tyrosine phosphatase